MKLELRENCKSVWDLNVPRLNCKYVRNTLIPPLCHVADLEEIRKREKEKENKSDKIAPPIGGEHIKISVDPIFC
jgi:hypothetical protein